MPKREIHCAHDLPISECEEHYAEFLAETTVGDVLENRMYGKSAEWRDGADKLLVALAKDNQYIVSDMLVIFLESSGFGLDDYSPLGGVFKRGMKAGIIKKVPMQTRQPLYTSKLFKKPSKNLLDQTIGLQGFGSIDGQYIVTDMKEGTLTLQRVTE